MDLAFRKETGNSTWRWRVYYDRYRYDGDWHLDGEDDIERNLDLAVGSSIGSQLTWRRELAGKWGAVTLGSEATVALQALQRNHSVEPEPVKYLDIDTPDRAAGSDFQHQASRAFPPD